MPFKITKLQTNKKLFNFKVTNKMPNQPMHKYYQ